MSKRLFLRSFLFIIIFLYASVAFAQLPPREPFSAQKWQSYAKKLLIRSEKGTKYEKLARKVAIEITNNNSFNATSDPAVRIIYIDRGRISLYDNEGEVVATLLHEFGHIALPEPPAEPVNPSNEDNDGEVSIGINMERYRKGEMNSDEFARAGLVRNGYSVCAQYEGFIKMVAAKGLFSQTEIGPLNKIIWERLHIMEVHCMRSLLADKTKQ